MPILDTIRDKGLQNFVFMRRAFRGWRRVVQAPRLARRAANTMRLRAQRATLGRMLRQRSRGARMFVARK